MRTLVLLRHSLTEGNERRLYYGSTDLPLSPAGVALALKAKPDFGRLSFDRLFTSGLVRTDQTLRLLTGCEPDARLTALREMDFGRFEMHGYEELKNDPDYRRWIDDCMGSGIVRCPSGESQSQFHSRVLAGGEALLAMDWTRALAVVHGGVIANLMAHWFPDEPRNFYQWQPGPCEGWQVAFINQNPVGFSSTGGKQT